MNYRSYITSNIINKQNKYKKIKKNWIRNQNGKSLDFGPENTTATNATSFANF